MESFVPGFFAVVFAGKISCNPMAFGVTHSGHQKVNFLLYFGIQRIQGLVAGVEIYPVLRWLGKMFFQIFQKGVWHRIVF